MGGGGKEDHKKKGCPRERGGGNLNQDRVYVGRGKRGEDQKQ